MVPSHLSAVVAALGSGKGKGLGWGFVRPSLRVREETHCPVPCSGVSRSLGEGLWLTSLDEELWGRRGCPDLTSPSQGGFETL